MTFTDPTFLLLFLPIVILLFYISKDSYKSMLLLLASVLFYILTSPYYLILLLVIIWLNFYLGKKIFITQEQSGKEKRLFLIGVLINVILLFVFKFLDAYGLSISQMAISDGLKTAFSSLMLPMGFSYLTFQNISYLVDVRNKRITPEADITDYAFYTLFFPKILVGPIMLYREMRDDIKNPKPETTRAYQGIRRVIVGLGKKVLIADTLARAINPSFNLASPEFSTGIAWFMLIAYALQLYYDFSGLTDIALGIGEIFGIRLVENFNYPYIAQSISDFWRRWHISLSSWVREYIFIPLEFKRRRVKFARQQVNILLTFLVVGFWHGLTPNFILWGLYNGLFLALEMTFLTKLLKRTWKPIRHFYTISVLLISWIFFRSNSLGYAFKFLGRLFGMGGEVGPVSYSLTSPLPIIDPSVWLAVILGIILAVPYFSETGKKVISNAPNKFSQMIRDVGYDVFLVFILLLSVASIVSTNTVGNIYGGF